MKLIEAKKTTGGSRQAAWPWPFHGLSRKRRLVSAELLSATSLSKRVRAHIDPLGIGDHRTIWSCLSIVEREEIGK
ncbi:hypothetical protein [Ensifer sesbaniae]|jgi:hypothetical protein|uniref:hypothetical protein n=1 Tax=Ensifer sesbaniae TaxID=1214071 RepID=UPI001FE953DD|nr:hypothetical protein [Ensifer sesbaniae]